LTGGGEYGYKVMAVLMKLLLGNGMGEILDGLKDCFESRFSACVLGAAFVVLMMGKSFDQERPQGFP
jgi:hypothetical protein